MPPDDRTAPRRSRDARRPRPPGPRTPRQRAARARANRHTGSLGRNLPMAVTSGIVLAVLFLGSLFLSAWVFLGFVAVVVVVALLELDRVFRSRRVQPATPVAIGAGLVLLFGAYASGPSAQSLGLVLLVLGAIGWALLYPVEPGGARGARSLGAGQVAANTAATCFMTLWVPFLASFLGLLLARPQGQWYVMATVALTVSGDIGAFAFGSHFGRHKLAPSISPAKTWEGLGGAILTVIVLAWLITSRLPGFDLPSALALGVGVAVAGTLGDLAESMVKRDLGVKDLGRIMPGHGGIMDRVDAIVFALPTAHIVLLIFGL